MSEKKEEIREYIKQALSNVPLDKEQREFLLNHVNCLNGQCLTEAFELTKDLEAQLQLNKKAS